VRRLALRLGTAMGWEAGERSISRRAYPSRKGFRLTLFPAGSVRDIANLSCASKVPRPLAATYSVHRLRAVPGGKAQQNATKAKVPEYLASTSTVTLAQEDKSLLPRWTAIWLVILCILCESPAFGMQLSLAPYFSR
jgi:hypothetical protein